MREIKAPHTFRPFMVFLAGSIAMGNASDWRGKLRDLLSGCDVLLLNPWRDDWDDSWEQRIEDAQFCQQVEWELRGIEAADLVVLCFEPETTAPITLLELGIAAKSPARAVVCCPPGFWRKGNVDVVCQRYGIDQVTTLDALAEYVRARVAEEH